MSTSQIIRRVKQDSVQMKQRSQNNRTFDEVLKVTKMHIKATVLLTRASVYKLVKQELDQ